MTRDDDLSAFMDGELGAVEHEATRQRLLRDPGAARAYETLKSVSAALRARFAAASAEVAPTTPPSLGIDALRRVDRAASRRAALKRALPYVVTAALIAAGCLVYFTRSAPAPDAESLRTAARETLAEEAYVDFSATAPAMSLISGQPVQMRGVIGPGGRFVGAVSVPKGTMLPGPLASVVAGKGERASVLRAGFDGRTFWRYAEGDPEVRTSTVDPELRSQYRAELMKALGFAPDFGGRIPGLDWEAWRDVVGKMAQGGVDVTPAGARTEDGESLQLFSV
jgi:hypothetical protein